jgi:hypothetical protein
VGGIEVRWTKLDGSFAAFVIRQLTADATQYYWNRLGKRR